jgi:hypothetical protein
MRENIPLLLDNLPNSPEIRARAIRDLVGLLPESVEMREAAAHVLETHRRKVINDTYIRQEGLQSVVADRILHGSDGTKMLLIDVVLNNSNVLISDDEIAWSFRGPN